MSKKVVLFHGRASSFDKPIKVAPLALLHISSFLVKDGFEVKIITDALYDDYINEALRNCDGSLCLGVTAMTGSQITEGLKLSRLVREKYPSMPVIWGGWHPSIMASSTLEDSNVDVVVCGQGERKFYELVKCLGDNAWDNIGRIPGVSFKKNGRLCINNDSWLEDMNNFPCVDYSLIDVKKCLIKTEYGSRTLQYISSYGCPCRCSFCIEPIVNKRRWTGLKAQRVVEEWEYLYREHNIDSIAVYDSNFFVDKSRVYQICRGLINKGVKIKWGNANGRIPQLVKYERDIWELMSESGLSMILTGSESGEQEVLNLIDKDADLSDIYRFSELCKEYGIRVLFSYMSGLPWSNDPESNEKSVRREIKSILSQTQRLSKVTSRNRFMVYAYTPLPGSKMYQKALEYGFNEPKTLKEWSELVYSPEDIFQSAGCKQNWITPKQLRLITMLEQYVFGMMDLDARDWIARDINGGLNRFLFKIFFNLGYFLARLRLKFKFFAMPLDYWLFVKFRKILKLH